MVVILTCVIGFFEFPYKPTRLLFGSSEIYNLLGRQNLSEFQESTQRKQIYCNFLIHQKVTYNICHVWLNTVFCSFLLSANFAKTWGKLYSCSQMGHPRAILVPHLIQTSDKIHSKLSKISWNRTPHEFSPLHKLWMPLAMSWSILLRAICIRTLLASNPFTFFPIILVACWSAK